MYKYLQDAEDEKVKGRINSFISPRIKNNRVIEKQDFENELNRKCCIVKCILDTGIKKHITKDYLTGDRYNSEHYSESTRSNYFFYTLMSCIGKADTHMNIANYHAEMVLDKYRNALEMHREGKSYQDMISNMYLIDGDLNNNTCQFYFAIERYYNNCGIINYRAEQLKSLCKVSSLLTIENYTQKPFLKTITMSKIVLIGASGFVGSAILNEALERGVQVTAVVRNPEKIKISNPNLSVVKADVSSVDAVAEIAKGAEAAISAYNPGWGTPDMYEKTLQTYPAILEGVKKAGVKRLLIVGGAATLCVSPGVRMIDTGVLPKEIIGGAKSLGEFYLHTLTGEKEIDWVFFSPPGTIEPGKRTGKYRLGKDDLIVDSKGESRISVQDYAKAMIDELKTPVHHKERFTIGY